MYMESEIKDCYELPYMGQIVSEQLISIAVQLDKLFCFGFIMFFFQCVCVWTEFVSLL